jgi:hypothetical protein
MTILLSVNTVRRDVATSLARAQAVDAGRLLPTQR